MLIEKETVIKELNDFADSLTVIGGSYIRSAIRVVIDPMVESPEAAELAELKHKVAVQDVAVKKLFDAMAKEGGKMNDSISRQAALDFVGTLNFCDEISDSAYIKLTSHFENLPSAEPQWTPCDKSDFCSWAERRKE